MQNWLQMSQVVSVSAQNFGFQREGVKINAR